MEPIGGWDQVDYPDFPSPVRAIHKWFDNSGNVLIAYLCEQHCFVDAGNDLIDVSPTPALVPPVSSDFGYGGYGMGYYGTDAYGTYRDIIERSVTYTPCYSIDNWGEDLVFMTSSDGRLFRWKPSTPGTPATIVPNAPPDNRSFVITPERFVILFGLAGAANEFGWCDQENIENWDFASTVSKAGFQPVEPRAPIVAHKKIGNGVLVFTDRAAALIRYAGLPFVYSYERISDCATPYSAASISEIPDGVVWPSIDGFWLYNGVNISPVPCPVWTWAKDIMDMTATKYYSTTVLFTAQSELWWFFAEQEGITFTDRYLVFNYRDGTWYMGKMDRTCGLSYPNDMNPIMSDGTKVFKHEIGNNYPGASELPWAESYTINMGGGSMLSTIHQMLPEVNGETQKVRFRLIKSNNPSKGPETVSAPKTIRSNGFVDVRETARDFRLKVEATAAGNWSMGTIDFNVKGRGQK